MPSTVYKGDLAEVSFAPETGLTILPVDDIGVQVTTNTGNDYTQIQFVATLVNTLLFDSSGGSTTNALKYPDGMLVGSQLKFSDSGSDLDAEDTAGVFTIVKTDSLTQSLYISPPMKSGSNGVAKTLATTVQIHILPYKTPPFDLACNFAAGGESVLTDQFLGIANALTLPETKVDLKRFHVVGLGRDTSVQVPGKFITEGGSFEVAMHSARWLKYCLGGEVISAGTASGTTQTLSGDAKAGQSYIDLTSASGFTPVTTIQYVILKESTDTTPVVTTHAATGGTWDETMTDYVFDKAKTHEVRRVLGLSGNRAYLDEPLQFDHPSATTTVHMRDYAATGTNPPIVQLNNGNITNAQRHLLFSHTYQPSFSLEVSQRMLNIDSDEGGTDGGPTDSKELTRVFRGCKVTDFTMTTDNDAALRLSVNFNAALCYTDTGRLNGGGSKFSAHRMFDDTASTDADRYRSGIAPKTQKPFMFYNGTINMAGVQVAQVLNFTLTGQTGMQSFHTINGQNSQSSATGQVPFGGSRNTNIMVEGQTSYEMTMEIGVDDPLFFHKMRSAQDFSISGDGDSDAINQIRIAFTKTTTTGQEEKMLLLIDDYVIVEAPLQIPEDKGMVKSQLKIMPKAIKVLAQDTIIKY